jgi:hypothetical protein
MSQVARDLTDPIDGLLSNKHYLIHDRDPLFTADCLKMFAEAGIESVRLPPRSPNLNAYAERFVRTHQGVLPRSPCLVWGSVASQSRPGVSGALSQRAKPPGTRQSPDRP